MGILFSVLAAVCVALLFSLAIFVHELGHFLAAKWLGFKIDAFSIGFGPAIWKRTVNGVEYKIGSVPLGGYVALPQLDPSGMESVQGEQSAAQAEENRDLPDVAPWKRIVVAVAGPFGNVVLAVVLAYIIFLTPGVKTGMLDTRIGWVDDESEAWQAGLRPGDRIQTVNGTKIGNWADLQIEYQLAGESGHASIGVLQNGIVHTFNLAFQTNNLLKLRQLEGVYPQMTCVIASVTNGSPAALSGLKAGDEIQKVNGVAVLGEVHFLSIMKKQKGDAIALSVRRGHETLDVTITPRYSDEHKRFLIGVVPSDRGDDVKPWMMYRDPWQQLKWDSTSVVRVLQALIAPKSQGERKAVAKNVGGPVAIVMGLYHTVQGGMMDALGFLRMICVNLAILNLLPLPVLDGGHVVFALYEVCTRRKPHPKVVLVLVNACAALLLGLMALLVYRDIARQVQFSRALRTLEQSEAGAAATNAPAAKTPAKP